MAPTPVIGGPCQEQLGLQAAGSGTGLSVVDGWGKGCLSRGHAQGTKALAGEWAGTTGARGSPRPLWVATAPLAAVLAPGALPPAEFARLLQPRQESKGKGFFRRFRVAGGTSPCGPGKHSAESKRNHSHFHSPVSVSQSPNPSKMSPALPPLRPPPRKKNQERGGNCVGGPQARRVHAEPGSLPPRQAPRPHPGKAPALAIQT